MVDCVTLLSFAGEPRSCGLFVTNLSVNLSNTGTPMTSSVLYIVILISFFGGGGGRGKADWDNRGRRED